MTILSFHLAYYEGKGTKLGEGKGTKLGEGEGTKLGEGERDLEGERATITFGIITIFVIRDYYIWDCFIREKFVVPLLPKICDISANKMFLLDSEKQLYFLKKYYKITQ
jgi:hypothetical protein